MRHLAAALVTIACMVPMVMGDLGMFNHTDARSYDQVASAAIALFALLCIFSRDQR